MVVGPLINVFIEGPRLASAAASPASAQSR